MSRKSWMLLVALLLPLAPVLAKDTAPAKSVESVLGGYGPADQN